MKKKKKGSRYRMEGGEREKKIGTSNGTGEEGDVYIDFLACTNSAKRFRDRNYGNERP